MTSMKWCCKQKDGIRLIEPNDNLASSYLKMAEDFLGTMNRERRYNLRSAISACYYSMYYSLYAILMRLGIKCEIHSCTLEFMKKALTDFYSREYIKTIKKAFDLREIAQYHVEKIILREDSDYVMGQAPLFFNRSKEILAGINENITKHIREKISGF